MDIMTKDFRELLDDYKGQNKLIDKLNRSANRYREKDQEPPQRLISKLDDAYKRLRLLSLSIENDYFEEWETYKNLTNESKI